MRASGDQTLSRGHRKRLGVALEVGARGSENGVAGVVGWSAAIWVLVGLGGALWMIRLINALLFEVSGTDPLSFALGIAALVVVALVAAAVPTRRATRVDPLVAMRAE